MQWRDVNLPVDQNIPLEGGVAARTWLESEPPLDGDLEIRELQSRDETAAQGDRYGPRTRVLILVLASLLAWGLFVLPVWLLAHG